jgi:hypothetical protein
MRGVPENHYRGLEYRDRLENLAEVLHLFAAPELPTNAYVLSFVARNQYVATNVTRPLDLQERIAILIVIIVVVIGTIGRQFDFPGRQGGVGVRDVHVPQPRATVQLRHVFLDTPRRPRLTSSPAPPCSR